MKEQECKLPVQEDYRCFLNNGKMEPSFKHRKLVIIAGFLLLIAMSLTIAFTFRSLSEISELRHEIEILKTSLGDLKKSINEDQYDDLYTEDPEYVEDQTEMLKPEDLDDSDYDNYYDYLDDKSEENYGESNDIVLINRVMTGEQFTKDAKEIKAPSRAKRNIIGYTEDGVPINSESFAEARRRNMTLRKNHPRHHFTTASPPSSYPYPYYQEMKRQEMDATSTSRPAYSRRSRVMHQEDKSKASRQINKKSSLLKSGNLQRNLRENSETEFTVVRDDQVGTTRHRPGHLETLDERHPRIGRMRPLPTAHFNGDTSRYVLGQHDNFNGNGHLRHPQRTFVDWAESGWFRKLGMERHFSFTDGVLTIRDSGLYFIYAQIYYYDEHDTNGFRVYKNDDTLLQCTTMTHTVDRVMKGNTCYTAAAEYLQENDRISLGDLSDSRYSLFEPGKSFFGVIKLGDVRIK